MSTMVSKATLASSRTTSSIKAGDVLGIAAEFAVSAVMVAGASWLVSSDLTIETVWLWTGGHPALASILWVATALGLAAALALRIGQALGISPVSAKGLQALSVGVPLLLIASLVVWAFVLSVQDGSATYVEMAIVLVASAATATFIIVKTGDFPFARTFLLYNVLPCTALIYFTISMAIALVVLIPLAGLFWLIARCQL